MMYEELASFYDALVQDEEATACWADFVETHSKAEHVLELACGSGDLAILLAQRHHHVWASDISEAMLAKAKAKQHSEDVIWKQMDMRHIKENQTFDTILCFCDSLNYLIEACDVEHMFASVYAHLENGGCFLFDMHTQERLEEFAEEYCEDGMVDGVPYEWTILAQEEYIYQNFVFYDKEAHPHLEQHIQRVYDPIWIQQQLEKLGFQVHIYTDFNQPGIQRGEKYFYVCKKENL